MHFYAKCDVGYKDKSLEKTLNISFYIDYIGEKRMKEVKVGSTTYYIQDEDDLISVIHQLAREGYSTAKIAQILGISIQKVRKYMSECW